MGVQNIIICHLLFTRKKLLWFLFSHPNIFVFSGHCDSNYLLQWGGIRNTSSNNYLQFLNIFYLEELIEIEKRGCGRSLTGRAVLRVVGFLRGTWLVRLKAAISISNTYLPYNKISTLGLETIWKTFYWMEIILEAHAHSSCSYS